MVVIRKRAERNETGGRPVRQVLTRAGRKEETKKKGIKKERSRLVLSHKTVSGGGRVSRWTSGASAALSAPHPWWQCVSLSSFSKHPNQAPDSAILHGNHHPRRLPSYDVISFVTGRTRVVAAFFFVQRSLGRRGRGWSSFSSPHVYKKEDSMLIARSTHYGARIIRKLAI